MSKALDLKATNNLSLSVSRKRIGKTDSKKLILDDDDEILFTRKPVPNVNVQSSPLNQTPTTTYNNNLPNKSLSPLSDHAKRSRSGSRSPSPMKWTVMGNTNESPKIVMANSLRDGVIAHGGSGNSANRLNFENHWRKVERESSEEEGIGQGNEARRSPQKLSNRSRRTRKFRGVSVDLEGLARENHRLHVELERCKKLEVETKKDFDTTKKHFKKEETKRLAAEEKYRELQVELLSSFSLRKGGYRNGLEQMRIEFEKYLRNYRYEVELELNALQSSLQEKVERILDLEEIELDLLIKLQDLETQINELKNLNETLEKKNIENEKELKLAESKISMLTQQRSKLSEDNDIMNAKLKICSSLRPDLEMLSKSLDEKVKDIQEQYRVYLQETIEQLKEAITQRSKMEEEKTRIEIKLKTVEEQVDQLKKRYEHQISLSNEKFQRLTTKAQSELKETQYENSQLVGLVQSLQLQVDELKVKLSAQDELSISDWDTENFRKEFESEHAKHAARIGEELKVASMKHGKLKDKNRRLKEEINSLKNTLASYAEKDSIENSPSNSRMFPPCNLPIPQAN